MPTQVSIRLSSVNAGRNVLRVELYCVGVVLDRPRNVAYIVYPPVGSSTVVIGDREIGFDSQRFVEVLDGPFIFHQAQKRTTPIVVGLSRSRVELDRLCERTNRKSILFNFVESIASQEVGFPGHNAGRDALC